MVKGYKTPQDEEIFDEHGGKVVAFEPRIITGGKEPPDGDSWLERKPVGSCFLAAKRAIEPGCPNYMLGLFRVGAKTEESVVLNSPEHPGNLYVNPGRFSTAWIEFEDLGLMITPEEEQKEKEAQDDSDRDQPSGGSEEGKVE